MKEYEAIELLRRAVETRDALNKKLNEELTIRLATEADLTRARSLIDTLEKTNKELNVENERLHSKISTMKQLAQLDGTLRQLYFGPKTVESQMLPPDEEKA